MTVAPSPEAFQVYLPLTSNGVTPLLIQNVCESQHTFAHHEIYPAFFQNVIIYSSRLSSHWIFQASVP